MLTNEEIINQQDGRCAICGRPLTSEQNTAGTYHIFGKTAKMAICNHCYLHSSENEQYPRDVERSNKQITYRRSKPLAIVLTILFGWIGMLYTNPRKSASLVLFQVICALIINFAVTIGVLIGGAVVGIVILAIMLIVYIVLFYLQAILMCVKECDRINGIWDVYYTEEKVAVPLLTEN